MINLTDKMKEVISSDFIVGKHNFLDLEIRDGGVQNGFKYFFDAQAGRLIKRFVLDETVSGIKTCCVVNFIEKDGKYTPRIELSKRKGEKLQKALIEVDNETKTISSRIDLKNCHENFWKLIDYIYSLKNIAIPKSGVAAVSLDDQELLDRVKLSKPFVQKVLDTFETQEAQELLIQAGQEEVNNLFSSVKQAKNKKALQKITRLLAENSSEHKLESWIKENDWVFGIEYLRRLDATKIGIHEDSDLLVEGLDGYVDLIELKTASAFPLFVYDDSHDCNYPSSKLSQVLGQTINYLRVMEANYAILKSEDGLDVLKPRAKIVIGRSSQFRDDKERAALKTLNDSLHNIEIITYDEIIARAERIVKSYEK
jgi:hypothetical protein